MNHDHNTVLTRRGARELSKEEAEAARGCLFIQTNVCTFSPTTGSLYGDGCGH